MIICLQALFHDLHAAVRVVCRFGKNLKEELF
jgi:hypothetical protein